MAKCSKCGSQDIKPYDFKPPIGGQHTCTPACVKTGIFCRNCRYLQETK